MAIKIAILIGLYSLFGTSLVQPLFQTTAWCFFDFSSEWSNFFLFWFNFMQLTVILDQWKYKDSDVLYNIIKCSNRFIAISLHTFSDCLCLVFLCLVKPLCVLQTLSHWSHEKPLLFYGQSLRNISYGPDRVQCPAAQRVRQPSIQFIII